MIKTTVQRLEDIVDMSKGVFEIPGVGHVVFEESHPHRPDWVDDFFGTTLANTLNILASSAKGLLSVPVQTSSGTVFFAITFGVGRNLLKDGIVEERFGLKVVLNSVNIESFRSIDKTTLGSVPKHSHEQMSKDVAPTEFGIDIEQDLVRSVTGKSQDPMLGKIISGRDALSVSVKVDVTTIVEFLAHCLDRYRSTDYKSNFDWIDQIEDVRDPSVEKTLNTSLVQRLINRDLNKIWMAIPEVINWSDLRGFRYGKPKRAELFDDLDITSFLATLLDVPLTEDILKAQKVFMISASTDGPSLHWSAFRCIYAELELNNRLYILNNGKWYGIALDFTSQVVADFNSTTQSSIALPDCTGNDESAYNIAATVQLSGSCCMDERFIWHGGGHSKVEFCDIYTSDKRIVHVKRYGQANVLSHLFAQGLVSGELFVSDAEFRQKLNEKLPTSHKFANPVDRPNPRDYEVVYAIISKATEPLDIPFFSKVSLRNARRRLTGFGYRMGIRKVQKIEPQQQTSSISN